MLVLLPLVALLVVWGLAYLRVGTARGALVYALTVWGIVLVALTELLSLFRALTLPGLLIGWLLVIAALAYAAYRQDMIAVFQAMLAKIRLRGANLLVLAGLVGLIGMIGLVALVAPPNTWDSMAYHMPRVFFWEQWHTISPFPTHTIRQQYQPPFAEFVMLHLNIFTGSDALANIGQWLALLFSCIGVSAITRQLGGDSRAQTLAAVLCASLPIAIMQATGSKNDLVTALWMVCLTYFILNNLTPLPPLEPLSQGGAMERGSHAFGNGGEVFIGLAAGLAIFTKGTAYVVVFPLLLWLGVVLLRRMRLDAMRPMIVIGIAMLLVNVGHFARNMSVFGSPLTPPSHEIYYANDEFSPRVLLVNLLRNTALHVYIPDQLNRPLNWRESAFNFIVKVHEAVGLELNDPRTTFPWNEFEIPPIWQIFNEDRVGNPVHVALFFLSLPVLFMISGVLTKPALRLLSMYLLVGIAQFCLFSLLLKWQVWGTRLQLPIFVYIAPFMAIVYVQFLHRYLTTLLSLGLLLMAAFFATNISTRPIFSSDSTSLFAITRYVGSDNIQYPSIFDQSRLDMYSNGRTELRAATQAAADAAAQIDCDRIGLISDESGWLYPLMMLLRAENPGVQLQHMNVTNETTFLAQQAPYVDFAPCAIISMYGAQPALPAEPTIDGRDYRREWTGEAYEIFIPIN